MTFDEKWEKVKEFYEQSYRIKFREVPEKLVINYLYNQMLKVKEELHSHYFEKPFLERNANKLRGLNVDPIKKRQGDE